MHATPHTSAASGPGVGRWHVPSRRLLRRLRRARPPRVPRHAVRTAGPLPRHHHVSRLGAAVPDPPAELASFHCHLGRMQRVPPHDAWVRHMQHMRCCALTCLFFPAMHSFSTIIVSWLPAPSATSLFTSRIVSTWCHALPRGHKCRYPGNKFARLGMTLVADLDTSRPIWPASPASGWEST